MSITAKSLRVYSNATRGNSTLLLANSNPERVTFAGQRFVNQSACTSIFYGANDNRIQDRSSHSASAASALSSCVVVVWRSFAGLPSDPFRYVCLLDEALRFATPHLVRLREQLAEDSNSTVFAFAHSTSTQLACVTASNAIGTGLRFTVVNGRFNATRSAKPACRFRIATPEQLADDRVLCLLLRSADSMSYPPAPSVLAVSSSGCTTKGNAAVDCPAQG